MFQIIDLQDLVLQWGIEGKGERGRVIIRGQFLQTSHSEENLNTENTVLLLTVFDRDTNKINVSSVTVLRTNLLMYMCCALQRHTQAAGWGLMLNKEPRSWK